MSYLYLTILFPLVGFLLLALSRGRWSENISAAIGVGSIALSFIVATVVSLNLLQQGTLHPVYVQSLWNWLHIGNFSPVVALRLDGLSLTMMGVVSGVGFLIHLFASWYMRGEEGYSRFFAYMNLVCCQYVAAGSG